MFECDSNDESEALMTRVIDALGATGGDNCSDHMDNVGHDVEETKLIELKNLIQQIKLTAATPAGVDVTSESRENGHKQQMEDSPNLAWQESPHYNQVVEQFKHRNSDVNDKDLSGQDELEDKKVCAMTAELSKIKEENALMKVEVVDILSTKEKLEKELSDKNEQLSDIKHNENELKESLILLETEINKNVKEKTDLESDLKKLIEEKLDVEEKKRFEIDQLKKENQAKTDEAEAIITQNAVEIENLTMQMGEIKADNEALRLKMAEKDERAKKVLTNAKVKIQKVELENKELQKQLDTMTEDFEAQINFLEDAKSKEEDKNEQLMKLGKNFMEVLNLAENENSSNKKHHTESNHQRPSSMSNEHIRNRGQEMNQVDDETKLRLITSSNHQIITDVEGGGGTRCLNVMNLTSDVFNCDKLFNLFCLYGNIKSIMFVHKNSENALVEFEDLSGVELVIKHLGDLKLFGQQLHLERSKKDLITSKPHRLIKDFTANKNNRFGRGRVTEIYPVTSTIMFFNMPRMEKDGLMDVFHSKQAPFPKRIKWFGSASKGGVWKGIMEFDSSEDAAEAVVLANHARVKGPLDNDVTIRFTFTKKRMEREWVGSVNF